MEQDLWQQTDGGTVSVQSVELNYSPIDDLSSTGYRRPPKVAGCVLDYFTELGFLEDGGHFAHSEMQLLLDHPEEFFS